MMKSINLWQHPLWAKFQEAIGQKTWSLTTANASALVIRHPLPFGLCWLEVPRGPLFDGEQSLQKILTDITALAKKERAVFVRLSPYDSLPVTNYELRVTSYDHHPQTSLILDLSLSDKDLLSQMKPKGRYNIKVAQKGGVIVKESQDVAAFHRMIQKTAARDGFSVHSPDYYASLLKTLKPHAQLFLAEKDGQPIAGGIFAYLDDFGIYYYGASDHEHRNLMAPYLIQWTAILEAKKRGCKHYDFLGVAPEGAKNHPWAGVTDFKMKFGGSIVAHPPAQEMVMRPVWYWAYRMMKKWRG